MAVAAGALEQVGKAIATEIASDAIETLPEIAKAAYSAPDEYTGLDAIGYGVSKTVPWLDVFNVYPKAHPGYWDPSEVKKLAEITPIGKPVEQAPQQSQTRPAFQQHTASSAPTPTHAPLALSYTPHGGRAYARNPKIWNPFTQLYISVSELLRLSKKNDSEGIWAKREIKKYKEYLPNK